MSGYCAWDVTYDTYSKREFERRFRQRNGLKGKHIEFLYSDESLSELLFKFASLYD